MKKLFSYFKKPCAYDIPLIEYDNSPEAVLQPDHEKLGITFPEKAVFAFLGDCIDEYAENNSFEKVTEFISITKRYPIYSNGDFVLCQAPVGASAAVQILDWLIAYGVKKIISAGSCGVLTDIPENAFLIPVKALRDEGTSFHYLKPSRFAETDKSMRSVIEKVFRDTSLPYAECTTWTTDGFFRETERKVSSRIQEGCVCVEMECSALAACAAFRGASFAEILFTADSLANTKLYDERDWGQASLAKALALCIEVIKQV